MWEESYAEPLTSSAFAHHHCLLHGPPKRHCCSWTQSERRTCPSAAGSWAALAHDQAAAATNVSLPRELTEKGISTGSFKAMGQQADSNVNTVDFIHFPPPLNPILFPQMLSQSAWVASLRDSNPRDREATEIQTYRYFKNISGASFISVCPTGQSTFWHDL